MDDGAAAAVEQMPHHGARARYIVDPQFRPALAIILAIEQDRRDAGRQMREEFIQVHVRRHDDEAVDPSAHVAQRLYPMADVEMHVGQQQMALPQRGLPLHAAQHFGEEFAMKVGQHHADRAGARHAEIAGAGMRHIVELAGGLFDPLLEFGADIGEAVEHARNGRDRDIGFARYVANGRLSYALAGHPQPICRNFYRRRDLPSRLVTGYKKPEDTAIGGAKVQRTPEAPGHF